MSLSFLSFNARGLRNNLKRKAIFLFIKQFKCDFYFIQESHSTKEDLAFWKSQWGKDLWGAHCSTKMAGVLVLKDQFSGEILNQYSDPNGHFILIVLSIHQNVVIITNIYGYNSHSDNRKLFEAWDDKISFWLGKYPEAFLIFGGDFNVVYDNNLDRSPPSGSNDNHYLKEFMEKFDVEDVFRQKFPTLKTFTWSTKNLSRMSRIDYWLVSNKVDVTNLNVNTHAAPFSDHKIITLNAELVSKVKIPRAVCWKMNNSLLTHATVIETVKTLINSHWQKACESNSFGPFWELLKFEISKFMRSFSSNLAKLRKQEENDICLQIASLSNLENENLSDEDLLRLGEYQNKLDEMYKRKAQGAFVRSRARWLEAGEQCSSYFF